MDTGSSRKKQTCVAKALSKLLDKPVETFAFIRPLVSEMDLRLAKALHPRYTEEDVHTLYPIGAKYFHHTISKVAGPIHRISILSELWGEERVAGIPSAIREQVENWLRAATEVFKEGPDEAPHKNDWYEMLLAAFPHSAYNGRDPRQVLRGASSCCTNCGAKEGHLNVCSSCATARYCKRECQLEDWRRNHKQSCWIVKYARAAGGIVEEDQHVPAHDSGP